MILIVIALIVFVASNFIVFWGEQEPPPTQSLGVDKKLFSATRVVRQLLKVITSFKTYPVNSNATMSY